METATPRQRGVQNVAKCGIRVAQSGVINANIRKVSVRGHEEVAACRYVAVYTLDNDVAKTASFRFTLRQSTTIM